jgi:hypothetical protein
MEMNVFYMLLLDFGVKSVERLGVVGSRCLAGRGRLLDYKESVEAARLRGVVRIALSSPRWRSPERETSNRGDSRRNGLWWLAKGNLIM